MYIIQNERRKMGIEFAGCELIEMAVRIERNGQDFYKEMANRTDDPEMKKIFLHLADEEKKHELTFVELGEKIGKEGGFCDFDDEARKYMMAFADSEIFHNDNAGVQAAKNAESIIDAIDAAILTEKESILFYYEMLKYTKPDDKKYVQEIIEEERTHLYNLTHLKRTLTGS